MPSQKTINIILGSIAVIVVASIAIMGYNVNSRLSYLEGKASNNGAGK